MKRLSFAAPLAAALLAACATQSPVTPTAESGDGLTPAFRACYAESKVPWLVAMAAGKEATTAELDAVVRDFVGNDPGKVKQAKGYLSDWRIGRHRDSENMAGRHFDQCMQQLGASAKHPERSVSCYKEQWLVFMAIHAKYEDKLPLDVATQRMLDANAADAQLVAATRRLYRDTYTLMKSASDPAYMEAQFHTCMNIYRYPS